MSFSFVSFGGVFPVHCLCSCFLLTGIRDTVEKREEDGVTMTSMTATAAEAEDATEAVDAPNAMEAVIPREAMDAMGAADASNAMEAADAAGAATEASPDATAMACRYSTLPEARASMMGDGDQAFRMTTAEMEEGKAEMALEDEYKDFVLPLVKTEEVEKIKLGQKDEMGEKIMKWLTGAETLPDKGDSLKYDNRMWSVIRHISLFKLNEQGIIFRLFVSSNGAVTPLIYLGAEAMMKKINEVHLDYAHMNGKRVFYKLSEKWFTPGLYTVVSYELAKCTGCVRYNVKQTVKGKGSTLLSTQSGRWVQMDYLGPLPSSRSYRYILGMVDSYDKRLVAIPTKSTGADELCEVLSKHFGENGMPEYVIIDGNCVSFRGLDKKLLDGLRIGIVRSNHRSQSQGYVERKFRDLLITILKLLDGDDYLERWSDVLNRACYVLNNLPNVALGGFSSSELVFRKPPRFLSTLCPLEQPEGGGGKIKEGFMQLNKIHEMIKDATLIQLLKNKAYYYPNEALTEGAIVFRKRMQFARNMASKLQPKIVEAFVVKKRIGTSMYLCQNVMTDVQKLLPIDQLIRCRLNLVDTKALMKRLADN